MSVARVVVVVPLYNHEEFIRRALDSLLAQTFQDWHAVVIDDRSSDAGFEIANSYACERIEVLKNTENLGAYATQQRALDLSQSEFVALLNSDDRWLPENLEQQIASIGSAQFSYALGVSTDCDDKILPQDLHGDWPREPAQELLPFLLEENRVPASGLLLRREGLRFDPECRYSGDWVALLEAAKRGPAKFVPQPLVEWRQHKGNTYVRSAGQLAEEIEVRLSIIQNFDFWLGRDLDPQEITRGLGRCALHLSALCVLSGDMHRAREHSTAAFRLLKDQVALRRAAVCLLPAKTALARIWPDQEQIPVERPYRRISWQK